jgi:hypothetical protein
MARTFTTSLATFGRAGSITKSELTPVFTITC